MPSRQPLSPEHLIDLPPYSFGTPLTPITAAACNAWYLLAESYVNRANLRPSTIGPATEQKFAQSIRGVVSTYVHRDIDAQRHDILPPDRVQAELDGYYALFPPSAAPNKARADSQDALLEAAFAVRHRFMEVGVMLGLQRACFDRRLVHATRATWAVLAAYGRVAVANSHRPAETES